MREVDRLLADRELVQIVYEALARRWPKSRTRGRPGTPADVVLRLLLLKHMRNWSYYVLEREVRANLVYRQFTRVGAQKVPDAKTLGKLALALGPRSSGRSTLEWWASPARSASFAAAGCGSTPQWWRPISITRPTARFSGMACGCSPARCSASPRSPVAQGPTARSLPRGRLSSQADRPRQPQPGVQQGQERLKACYRELLYHTARVVGQAKRFAEESPRPQACPRPSGADPLGGEESLP